MRIIDISRPVTPATAVFPGDTPFSISQRSWGEIVVGAIETTLHIGTHADAPAHFLRDGAGAGELDLRPFCGEAVVVVRTGDGPLTESEAESWEPEAGLRYLVRTRAEPASSFPDEFAHLTAGAARVLARAGVALFGIDTPSVDHRDSRSLDAHRALAAGGVAILENLDLGSVAPGRYELIALPLRIVGADASPVRAVLRAAG